MPESDVDTLIECRDAFLFSEERDNLFFNAMKTAFSYHFRNCEPFRRLCHFKGVTPESLKCYQDIFAIPWLFVTVLKERSFVSVAPEKVHLVLTSSGTTGTRSAISLDRRSLRRIRKIVRNIYASFGMASKDEKVNYLLFTYDPRVAKDLGTAYSDRLLTGLTKVNKIYYAIQFDRLKGEFALNRKGCCDALERFSQAGLPMRIVGFPSFLYDVLSEYMKKRRIPFSFGERSFVIIGGGWKTLGDREVPKEQFRREVSEWLGIPASHIRDLLGMVEHGVPYCECEKGNFHVPIYSRAAVRHPLTLEILPFGEKGIFHFLTPYHSSYPAISLLTTDVGKLHEGCACGRKGPWLELLGRGGVRKHRGCAIAALDILERDKAGLV
ncbi:MAG: acyl-protein synthetase [Candidatus Xenobiia bacterium LiM19]